MTGELLYACTSLAVEQWKLIGIIRRLASSMPSEAQARVLAQHRYATSKLANITAEVGLDLETFDGREVDATLPISVINIEDFGPDDVLTVRETVEPTIVYKGVVQHVGRVLVEKET